MTIISNVILNPVRHHYQNLQIEGKNLIHNFKSQQIVTKEKVQKVVFHLLDFISALRLLSFGITLGFFALWKVVPLVSFPFFIGFILSTIVTYDLDKAHSAIQNRSWKWRSSKKEALPNECIDRISESAFYMRKSMLLLWPLVSFEVNYLPSLLGLIKKNETESLARENNFFYKALSFLA